MMKKMSAASVAAVMIASQTMAGDAAQWRVEDGGNGHWYANVAAAPLPTTISAMQHFAASRGASLASITSAKENQVILSLLQSIGAGESFSAWIGLYRAIPGDPWRWTDGSQTTWTGWGGTSCSSGPYPNDTYFAGEIGTVIYRQNCGLIWDDSPTAWIQNPPPWWEGVAGMTLLLEWSADCNRDNIVDYGQCRGGTLPDYNGNNVPDCCERGEACVVGNYPVQWRTEVGGNGHWYSGVDLGHPVFWVEARHMASARGGHLATPSAAGEDRFLVTKFLENARLYRPDYSCCEGPYIGAFNDGAGWKWVDGTPWSYTNWWPGAPNEIPFTVVVYWARPECQWQDQNDVLPEYKAVAYIIEWDADCNNDGTVDYGQILLGQLADTNTNGIPDTCECVGDIYVDRIIDGGDLGVLLAYWGPTTSTAASIACDLNVDGVVNGSDLGILLAYWGPCSN